MNPVISLVLAFTMTYGVIWKRSVSGAKVTTESSKVQAHRDVRGDDDGPAAQVAQRVDAAESGVVGRERLEILKFPGDRVPTPNVARFLP